MKKGLKNERMDEHLTLAGKSLRPGYGRQSGVTFCWKIRPWDTLSNRRMVADLILSDMENHDGVFGGSNVFIERFRSMPTGKEK